MTNRRATRGRPGTIIPMLAIALVGLFAFVALAIDLGLLTVARTECQDAADAAALTGARLLDNNPNHTDNNRAAAEAAAKDTVKGNYLWNDKFKDTHITTAAARAYSYNTSTQQFELSATKPSGGSWSAMEVLIETTHPTFFAKVFGVTQMQTGAKAVAVHRPRDIAFVLDFSGSMKFSSINAWPFSYYFNSNIEGVLNPDPFYPKFGHYARYAFYNAGSVGTVGTPSPSLASSSDPAQRPNPLRMLSTEVYVDPNSGERYELAPNNHTMHSVGGPPMVWEYWTAPGNPAVGSVNPTTMTRAFKMWDPAIASNADTSTLTPERYTFTGYNAFTAACPAPENFETQSDTPIAYVGDKWPRANGKRGYDSSQDWATLSGTTLTENGAKTAQEFLNSVLTTSTGRDLGPSYYVFPLTDVGYAHPDITRKDGGNNTSWTNYRDAIWEAYGYDLDVADLRGQTSSGSKVVRLLPTADRFKGYSMGPMYWGKTFFIWPPDPRFDSGADPTSPATTGDFAGVKDTNGRWICDWRRRFFLRGDGQPFDPQTDNINYILFTSSAGHTLNPISTSAGSPGYYRLNYRAILAWLKSGPQTLPGNLRAGRIVYYSSIPTDADGTSDLDKRFWREYIHYLFGIGTWNTSNLPLRDGNSSISFSPPYNPVQMLAGTVRNFPFGGSPTVNSTNTATFTPTGQLLANPKPYMKYSDNINRPLMHFWFGPQTMVQFINSYRGLTRQLGSGTVKEAQCWQLKAAINSVLDDVRINHPNDYCGMAFFCNRSGSAFYTPRAPMSQDWYRQQKCLFFRKGMLDVLAALPPNQRDTAANEERPYNSNFDQAWNDMPNADGGTDPNSGLAVAFNLLSSAPSLNGTDGYPADKRGRRGAAKIVIFETDGVPNARGTFRYTAAGLDSRYISGTSQVWAGDTNPLLSTAAKAALEVIRMTTLPTATSGTSGHSLPNSDARVYPIAFGDMFNAYDGTNFTSLNTKTQEALYFLTRAAQLGKTLPMADVGNGSNQKMLLYDQVITGPYDVRIDKLRTTLERIMQSGVQVTLIE